MDTVLSVIIGSRVYQGPSSLKGISMNQMNKMAAWSGEINLIEEMRSALSDLNKTEKKSPRIFLLIPRRQPRKV